MPDIEHVREMSDALLDLMDDWNILEHDERLARFKSLEISDAKRFFFFLDNYERSGLLQSFDGSEAQIWIRLLAPDDAADILRDLPRKKTAFLMSLLDDFTRAEVAAILSYDEDSAGGMMSPLFLRARINMTMGEAIEYIRKQMQHTRVKATRYAYVLDEGGILKGVVSMRDLLTSRPSVPVAEVMSQNPIAAIDNMSTDEIRQIHDRYKFQSIPVVDEAGHMKGMLSIEEILEMVEEEATEDIQRLGATESLGAPYFEVPFRSMIRKRAGWLSVLLIGEMFTATAMGHYEDEIKRAVVLALFIPLIISSGGNSGSQASTLMVRAIAVGDVKQRDWLKVFLRESASGLVLGGILGVLGFARIFFWPMREVLYGKHYIRIAFTVGFSLVSIVLWGSLAGSMLPFLLRKLRFDPATASAPAVATLVDVTGIVLYFTCAKIFLSGILL
jgi:magnesium transporter